MKTWSTDTVRDCGSINRSVTVTSKGYAGGGLSPPDNTSSGFDDLLPCT